MWEYVVVEFVSERDRRVEALRLVDEEGLSVTGAARRVGRSRRWLTKWRGRAAAGEGLQDRSRAPSRSPNTLPDVVVARILTERDRLVDDPVASVGGLTILAELERVGYEPLPSLRSIERTLTRAGRTRRYRRRSRSRTGGLPLPTVGHVPGVWQQADWIQNRYLTGGFVFNSLQVTDVGSEGIAAGQYQRRTLANAVGFLIEHAWPTLSIPQAISIDNAFVKTTHRNNPWTLWTRACLFFGVEVVVSPPGELGWTNHVENFNNLWQDRTIGRHHCDTLDDVRYYSDLACDWFNTKRPILNPEQCGTRYPATLITSRHTQLRWPPDLFITDHLDHTGTLHIPLTNGRLTFLRRVHNNTITITHTHWPTPELPDGTLTAATITTHNQTLTIRHNATTVTTHPYPITHPITNPYYTPHPTSIYHHI